MENKTTKRLWIAVAIGVFILLFLIILASVINLGEKLSVIHPYIEIGRASCRERV